MKQTISGIVPFQNALKEDLVARMENLANKRLRYWHT